MIVSFLLIKIKYVRDNSIGKVKNIPAFDIENG
jgi:hypothetical protein